MGRDREQVLGESVVDFARDTSALLSDCAAELGEADCSPDARQQQPVGQEPEEVSLRDDTAGHDGREDVVEVG
jgi:hypothetical protein